jgi:hypothetical protein
MMSFLDDFRIIAILLFAIIPLLLLMKGTKLEKAPSEKEPGVE